MHKNILDDIEDYLCDQRYYGGKEAFAFDEFNALSELIADNDFNILHSDIEVITHYDFKELIKGMKEHDMNMSALNKTLTIGQVELAKKFTEKCLIKEAAIILSIDFYSIEKGNNFTGLESRALFESLEEIINTTNIDHKKFFDFLTITTANLFNLKDIANIIEIRGFSADILKIATRGGKDVESYYKALKNGFSTDFITDPMFFGKILNDDKDNPMKRLIYLDGILEGVDLKAYIGNDKNSFELDCKALICLKTALKNGIDPYFIFNKKNTNYKNSILLDGFLAGIDLVKVKSNLVEDQYKALLSLYKKGCDLTVFKRKKYPNSLMYSFGLGWDKGWDLSNMLKKGVGVKKIDIFIDLITEPYNYGIESKNIFPDELLVDLIDSTPEIWKISIKCLFLGAESHMILKIINSKDEHKTKTANLCDLYIEKRKVKINFLTKSILRIKQQEKVAFI